MNCRSMDEYFKKSFLWNGQMLCFKGYSLYKFCMFTCLCMVFVLFSIRGVCCVFVCKCVRRLERKSYSLYMWIIGISVACCIDSIKLIPFSIHNSFHCHLISLHGRYLRLPRYHTLLLFTTNIHCGKNCIFHKKCKLKK